MKPKEVSKTGSASAEENKALVRSLIEAINQQDWPRFDQLVAPDFLRHSGTFDQPEVRTRDELREFLAGEFVAFPDAHETINFLVAEGDKVAVHSQFRGTQRGRMGSFAPSGQVLSACLISIYRIAEGRVAEVWIEWDALNSLVKLGHLPPPSG